VHKRIERTAVIEWILVIIESFRKRNDLSSFCSFDKPGL